MLAIDFGTSRTKVAYYDATRGRVSLAQLGNGDQVALPSLFYVNTDGQVYCGTEALDFLDSDPRGTVRRVKSRLRERAIRVNGQAVPPVDLVTKLFNSLRARAGDEIPAFAGNPPTSVILTLPAAGAGSGPVVESIMRTAAAAAGFTDVQLMTEPEGAARAWQHEEGGGADDVVVILDSGGGTADWACLKRVDGTLRLYPDCPPGGDDKVGGEYLDEDLFGLLVSKLEDRQAGDALKAVHSESNKWFSRLRGLRERFNRTGKLGAQDALRVLGEVVSLSDDEVRGAIDARFINQVCDGFGRYLDAVRRATGAASPRVLLVGGMGQVSGLKEALRDSCGCEPTWWQLSEVAPVIGAAWWGAERAGLLQQERPHQVAADGVPPAGISAEGAAVGRRAALAKAGVEKAAGERAAAERQRSAQAAAPPTSRDVRPTSEQIPTMSTGAGGPPLEPRDVPPSLLPPQSAGPSQDVPRPVAGRKDQASTGPAADVASASRRWPLFALAAALLLGCGGLGATVAVFAGLTTFSGLGAAFLGSKAASIKFDGGPPAAVHDLDPFPLKTATIFDASGQPLDPQPTDLVWSVAPAGVVVLDSDRRVLTPVGNGDATIEASVGQAKGSYKVVIALPDKVEIDGPDTVGVAVGDTLPLSVTVLVGPDRLDGASLRWYSADATIARVDQMGLVTGVSPGVTQVKAGAGGRSARVEVTVTGKTRGPAASTGTAPPSAPARTGAATTSATARSSTATRTGVEVWVARRDAAFEIDGLAGGTVAVGGFIPLPPGRHDIVVHRTGRDFRTTVDLSVGETKELW